MCPDSYLGELADPSRPLKTADLPRLSNLPSTTLDSLSKAWSSIETIRRREILSQLTTLAEDNPHLDFTSVLQASLTDKDNQVRQLAINGLWECEERSLIPNLIQILRADSSEAVRAAAAAGLGRFAILAEQGSLLQSDSEKISEALFATLCDNRETPLVHQKALEAIGPFSLPQIKALILNGYESPDMKMKASALYAMGLNCNPDWLPILYEALKRDEAALRYEAATACGEIGDKTSVPNLIPMVDDPDNHVQLAAIDAMGKIGGTAAKQELLGHLKNPDGSIRDAAENALDNIEAEDTLGAPFTKN